MSEDLARPAVYARVSTDDQDCSAQIERGSALCAARGWGVPRVFRDDGVSGIRDNRPALDAMRAAMRRGEITHVVATKIDRLGRSVQMLLRFWDEADAAGVSVILIDQGIDTSTPAGRLQRTMLAAVAEFERDLIEERREEGVAAARARGVRFGRPPKYTEEQRSEIRSRLSDGQSVRNVSQALKVPRATVAMIGKGVRPVTTPAVSGGSSRESTSPVPQGHPFRHKQGGSRA